MEMESFVGVVDVPTLHWCQRASTSAIGTASPIGHGHGHKHS